MRGDAKEDPAVLSAMAQLRDRHADDEFKRRRLVSHTNILELRKQNVTDKNRVAEEELAQKRKSYVKYIISLRPQLRSRDFHQKCLALVMPKVAQLPRESNASS